MADLTGGPELALLSRMNPRLGALLQRVISGVNTSARNAGVSAVGQSSPPPPPTAVTVKTSGEMVHLSIADNGPVRRGIRYFSEVSTSPDYSNPLVIDHGTSRTSHPFTLPTMNDDGEAHSFYMRSYSQMPGSPPSAPVELGAPVTLGGATKMTLLQSTGSGTASANGSQGGYGLGRFPQRTTE